jgi:hypothetical protein
MIWEIIIIGCKFLAEIGVVGSYQCLDLLKDLQEMELYGQELP